MKNHSLTIEISLSSSMFNIQSKLNILPYIIVIITLVAILFTYPLMTYPYDIYAHLIAIDESYNNLPNSTSIPNARLIWHDIWGKIFYIFNIDNMPFLRARIIHIVQSYLAIFFLYYFSKVILRNLFHQITPTSLFFLSFWSTIIWFTLFASIVGVDHQVWNQFYSVNYQITLPLFWYMSALTLVLLLENPSIKKKIFF